MTPKQRHQQPIYMEFKQIVGHNLKLYRENFGYSQEDVAKFLKIDRSTISNYERGEREIPFVHLKNLCNLYQLKLSDLTESNPQEVKSNFAFAFKKENFDVEDMQSIAEFQKIVKNYLKLRELANN